MAGALGIVALLIWWNWDEIANALVGGARSAIPVQAQLYAAGLEIVGPLAMLMTVFAVDEHGIRGLDGRFTRVWPVALAAAALAAFEIFVLNALLVDRFSTGLEGWLGEDVGRALWLHTAGWVGSVGVFALSVWGPLKIRASSVWNSARRK